MWQSCSLVIVRIILEENNRIVVLLASNCTDNSRRMFKCTVIKNGVKSKSHPLILKHYIKEDINLETLIVIDIVLGYFQHWDKSMENDFMWKDLHFKIKKYKPFLTISKERYKKILKKVFV